MQEKAIDMQTDANKNLAVKSEILSPDKPVDFL